MKVSDLREPITAAKADWLPGDTWIGFTPTGGGPAATAQCQSAIQRQMQSGYVIEYITKMLDAPNAGFENDPAFIERRDTHAGRAGRLVAVHRLRYTARSLKEVLGEPEYGRLQDMWSQNETRNRWSVAFPIIESFEVVGRPLAEEVLGAEAYRRVFQHSSATLRALNESDRQSLSDLEIVARPASNAWIAIEDDFEKARKSEISGRLLSLIGQDLNQALEGMPGERAANIRRRAAWLADKFFRDRRRNGALRCEHCEFDPSARPDLREMKQRTLFDVHHRDPLSEGVRCTSIEDFVLLCPTCHRIEHERIRLANAET